MASSPFTPEQRAQLNTAVIRLGQAGTAVASAAMAVVSAPDGSTAEYDALEREMQSLESVRLEAVQLVQSFVAGAGLSLGGRA